MRLAIRFLGWYSLNSPENRHTKEKHENRKRGPGNDWTHHMYQWFRVLHSVCCPLIVLLLVLLGLKKNERHQLYFKSNPIQPIKQTTKKTPPPFFPSNRVAQKLQYQYQSNPPKKTNETVRTCVENFQTQTLWLQSNPSNSNLWFLTNPRSWPLKPCWSGSSTLNCTGGARPSGSVHDG